MENCIWHQTPGKENDAEEFLFRVAPKCSPSLHTGCAMAGAGTRRVYWLQDTLRHLKLSKWKQSHYGQGRKVRNNGISNYGIGNNAEQMGTPCAPPLWWWQRLWHPVPHTGDSNCWCCKTHLRGLPLKIPHKAQHWECNGNQNENVFQWGWQRKTQKLNFIKTPLFWLKGWLQCVTS